LRYLEDLLCSSVENLDESYFAIEDLFKKGQQPRIELLNIILRACSRSNEYDRAFHTMQSLASFNLKPNVETFHGLLDVSVFACSIFSSFYFFFLLTSSF
jgi:pentatricopeptide repeat protein